jgi:hypothetical protein
MAECHQHSDSNVERPDRHNDLQSSRIEHPGSSDSSARERLLPTPKVRPATKKVTDLKEDKEPTEEGCQQFPTEIFGWYQPNEFCSRNHRKRGVTAATSMSMNASTGMNLPPDEEAGREGLPEEKVVLGRVGDEKRRKMGIMPNHLLGSRQADQHLTHLPQNAGKDQCKHRPDGRSKD